MHLTSFDFVITEFIRDGTIFTNSLRSLFFVHFRDAEVTDLKKQLQSHQENIQKLHSEREDLMQKIQDGEGTNAALQQLKEQNVRLIIYELTRIKIH